MKATSLKKLLFFGKDVLNHLLIHHTGTGGKSIVVIGEQGSGKSSILLRFALIEAKRKEIVVWRGRETECLHYWPEWKEKTIFWVFEEDMSNNVMPRIYLVKEGGGDVIRVNDVRYETFKSTNDLVKKLRRYKGYINVIYEPRSIEGKEKTWELLEQVSEGNIGRYTMKRFNENEKFGLWKPYYFWYELLYKLKMRLFTDWITLCIDEVDDIIPPLPSGVEYYFVNWLKDSIKDLRKTNVSLFMTVHNTEDIHFGILRKIQYLGVTRGARIPKYWNVNFNPGVYLYMLREKFQDKIPVFLIEGKAEYGIALIQRFPTPEYQMKIFYRDLEEEEEGEGGEEVIEEVIMKPEEVDEVLGVDVVKEGIGDEDKQ